MRQRKADEPCRFFAAGGCARGASCLYQHENAAPRSSRTCHFFLAGNCAKGQDCRFIHDDSQGGQPPAPAANNRNNSNNSNNNNTDNSKGPCSFFAAGRCTQGHACRFSHDQAAAVDGPCRYFAAGYCSRGDDCRFAHDDARGPGPAAADPRRIVPCRYFAAGTCNVGVDCPFLHDLALQPDEELDPVAEVARFCLETDDLADDWTRVMYGARVKFGDGASVQSVELASDFAGVRLDGLPPGSTPASVVAALAACRVRVREEDVRIRPAAAGAGASAEVKVKNRRPARFAAEARQRLEAGGSGIRASRIDVSMPSGSSLHRVDCRKVQCSWHSPRRTVWLNFASRRAATVAYDHLNDNKIYIQGRLAVPGVPTGPRYDKWTVRLPNMDPATDEVDFWQALPQRLRLVHVELDRPTYDTEPDLVADKVEAMLRDVGPLESWTVTTSQSGKRIKVQARFANEGDAERAAETLNGRVVGLPDSADGSPCEPLRIAVQHAPQATMRVLKRTYVALKDTVTRQQEVWSQLPKGKVRMTVHPSPPGHVVFRFQGDDSKMVADAMYVLTGIFNGVELEVSKDAWCTVIQNYDSWRNISRRISRDFGVAIVRDKRRSQLRVFGEVVGYEKTRSMIAAEVEKSLSEARVIELGEAGYRWACWGGGFKDLARQMGRERLAIDTMSTPRRILCMGCSDAQYRAIRAIVDAAERADSSASSARPGPRAADAGDCNVCLSEAEEALSTPCGHVYCAGCFASLCGVENTFHGDRQVACVGDRDTCKTVLPLAFIKEHLSSAQFEKLLEDAFRLHVRRHPQDFRPCHTPNCERVYRVGPTCRSSSRRGRNRRRDGSSSSSVPERGWYGNNDDGRDSSSDDEAAATAVFTCPTCMQSTCTACYGPAHQGYSCAEYQDISTGGYEALARAKVELGVKDCPNCTTAIEKTEGCNHMTCSGCGTHICWVCLAVFNSGPECYTHLTAQHGGPFDVEEERL